MSKSGTNKQRAGFGLPIILLIIAVIIGLGGISYMVLKPDAKKSINGAVTQTTETTPKESVPAPTNQPEKTTDLQYSNDKYGISFSYPKEWTIEEVPNDKPVEPLPVEFSININFNISEKYKTAASLEVINKDYASVVSYYEANYKPTDSFKVSKTEATTASGKQSTHFINTTPNTKPNATREEQYLFAVGAKTYSFNSHNSELNVQRDAEYWQKIDKIAKSLQLR